MKVTVSKRVKESKKRKQKVKVIPDDKHRNNQN